MACLALDVPQSVIHRRDRKVRNAERPIILRGDKHLLAQFPHAMGVFPNQHRGKLVVNDHLHRRHARMNASKIRYRRADDAVIGIDPDQQMSADVVHV